MAEFQTNEQLTECYYLLDRHHSSIQYNRALSRSNLHFITHKIWPMKKSEAKVSHHKSKKTDLKVEQIHLPNAIQYNANTKTSDTWKTLINTEIRP